MFDLKTKANLGTGVLLKRNPIYVQFYITARCNLTCEQCNIIYANSDVKECDLAQIEKIAENLARVGTAIVLLTGGEPFVRKDLPDIIRAFTTRGIHVRMQTNGLASEEELAACVRAGGRDISISLDSLNPSLQDEINGGFPGSWKRAVETISKVTKYLPKDDCFASFGCVLSPKNIGDVAEVVKFATAIGWYTSLVPVHITDRARPMNFRTYDKRLAFRPEHFPAVDSLMEELKSLKKNGYTLYDSDEYLDDIRRFVRREPIHWRNRNKGVCDSPNLYFAILPNGNAAVCCDFRLPGAGLPVYEDDFPKKFREASVRERFASVTKPCEGCMFGSYPEMTITARYFSALWERAQVFFVKPPKRDWPLSVEQLESIAANVRRGVRA